MALRIIGEVICKPPMFRGHWQNMVPIKYINSNFHSFLNPSNTHGILQRLPCVGDISGNCWSLNSIRTNIRNNFPRPSEVKRQKMNWNNRMKTRGGRAILMRRYLKGRHVLSH